MIHRRQMLEFGALASLAGLLPAGLSFAEAADALAAEAVAAGETQVVMAGGTGAYAETIKRYFYDPFTEATGIRVIDAGGSYGEKLAKLKAMVQVGRVEWDVLSLSLDSLIADNRAFFRYLGESCEAVPNIAVEGVDGACVRYGAMFDLGGGVLTYNTAAFADRPRQPLTWADFWDVETFPGPRGLPDVGTPWWNLIAALLADGVEPDALFPLDLERAFAKLNEIRPHVAVWWRSGDQSQQIFRSEEVVMAMMFVNRARSLQREGLPLEVSWEGAPLDASVWTLLADAPHPKAAAALLNFIYSRPEVHAAYMAESGGATAMRAAPALMDPAAATLLPTAPETWSKIVVTDNDWLSENQEAVLRRWAEWIAG